MFIQDTTTPYETVEHTGIQYTNCRDFNHISRYRNLRQVVHGPETLNRFTALETPNDYHSSAAVVYHEVTTQEENRLDIIASKYLGSESYSWVIAYFNDIEDGYTCIAGQVLKIPSSIDELYNSGGLLASKTAIQLNLGTE